MLYLYVLYRPRDYNYWALKRFFFLITNDEDLFEHYFQDYSRSYNIAFKVFCIDSLKDQCFLVQNLYGGVFTVYCDHLQNPHSQRLVHHCTRRRSRSSHSWSDFHLHMKINASHIAIKFFNHTPLSAESLI